MATAVWSSSRQNVHVSTLSVTSKIKSLNSTCSPLNPHSQAPVAN